LGYGVSLQLGTLLIKRYRLTKLLGEGGFGVLYLARDMVLDRQCAVKENLDISPEAQRQFIHEAKILANLAHSNLPRVTDYFIISNQGQYLVMDYIEGEDLQDILDDYNSPLPEEKVLPWIEQICDALDYLHKQNPAVIHRDIKPANIRITPKGVAMLVDFGIAKIYGENLKTTLGAQAVSPGFSPVEQYGKGSTNARSDIYSLGATLYTLLCGQEPPESVQRAIRDTLTPPRIIIPELSQKTEAAVLRALQVDPAQRFGNVLDLKAALSAPQPASPVYSSQPATPPVTPSKPTWQRWVPVLIVLLVSGLFMILLGRNLRGKENSMVVSETSSPLLSSPSLVTRPASPVPSTEKPETSDIRLLPMPVPTPMLYTVQRGDTCLGIAESFSLTVQTIISINHLPENCDVLFAGQKILLPVSVATQAATTTSTILSTDISVEPPTVVSAADGMELINIPGGAYLMGSKRDITLAEEDELPQHWIYLEDFWIDRTEVTNRMYSMCVNAGACQPPGEGGSKTRFVYYGDANFDGYPVIYTTWEDAQSYCQWAGRRLPSEAEWEKASRGIDGRIYPWGDLPPNRSLLNFNNHVGDTVPVGSYSDGESPYGVFDMAGNVAEWVRDWYSADYYFTSPSYNPLGPPAGTYRVIRGGSWFSKINAVRTAFRLWNISNLQSEFTGFRCALSK